MTPFRHETNTTTRFFINNWSWNQHCYWQKCLDCWVTKKSKAFPLVEIWKYHQFSYRTPILSIDIYGTSTTCPASCVGSGGWVFTSKDSLCFLPTPILFKNFDAIYCGLQHAAYYHSCTLTTNLKKKHWHFTNCWESPRLLAMCLPQKFTIHLHKIRKNQNKHKYSL